jgi:hypothetical protein
MQVSSLRAILNKRGDGSISVVLPGDKVGKISSVGFTEEGFVFTIEDVTPVVEKKAPVKEVKTETVKSDEKSVSNGK